MLIAGLFLEAILASGTQVEPTASRAWLRQNLLCFESSVEIDWEAAARRELKTSSIENPLTAELRKEAEGGHDYYLDYTAPLPDVLSKLHFYLLSESGVIPIAPQRIYGSIRYRMDVARPEPEFVGGEICLLKPQNVLDAGFVVAAHVPIEWSWKRPETISYGQQLLVRLESGASRLPPPGIDGHPPTVKSLIVVAGSGLHSRYLLARRAPDSRCVAGCCEFAYDLYRWEAGLPQILWSAYDCDI